MRRFYLIPFVVLFLLSLCTASCNRTERSETGEIRPKVGEIRKEYRQGPFSVRLVADKDSLSCAESVVLSIEAETEDGYEVVFPEFGDKLGEFSVRDHREEKPQRTREGRTVTRKIITLDPFLPGDYTIAPMQVRFHKKVENASGEESGSPEQKPRHEHEITTEEITIRVNSLLEKERKPELNPIKGPVSLPAEPLSPLAILLGLGAAALAAGGAFLLIKRRRLHKKESTAPPLPAHETAYRQIQDIFDEKLIERGEIKRFFSRLSDVLRSYIENRFGLHAPKRTTEEFLTEISRDAPFHAEHKRLLVEFLHHCDLVKFAEHQPSQDEIQRAIDSCKAFIEATRDDTETHHRVTVKK